MNGEFMKKEFRKLISSIIHILMGIQIGFGVIWMIANLGELPRFRESVDLCVMSESLRADEYTGFLYLLCIRLLVAQKAVGLYVLQLALACVAYFTLLKKMGVPGKRKCVFYTGFLVTIPVVLQVHMAILPYSMASSVFLLLLADVIQFIRKEEILATGKLVKWGIFWILDSQLSPEYGWFCAILTGGSLFAFLLRKKQFWIRGVLFFFCTLLCVGGLSTISQNPGEMGRMHKSVPSSLLLRVVWPDFSTLQFFWDPQVTEVIGEEELIGISYFPEKVIYEFGPVMEAAYGREKAEELYMQMVRTAFFVNTKEVMGRVGEEALANMCPPLTVTVQLQGMGSSYAGWNYGRMKDYTPVLTKYYVQYATNAWLFMGAGSVLSVVGLCWKRNTPKKDKSRIQLLFLGIIMMIDLWYVIHAAHMQDYLKLTVNSVIWGVWMLALLERNSTKEA